MINGNFEKLVANLRGETKYIMHIRIFFFFKKALNGGLVLNKVYKLIKFNQNAWLKPYIDLNTAPREKANNDF